MSEEDVRGGLRDAVLAEPPLNFDADALVATARRQNSRRRSFVAAGLATVAVAVAAVAVPVALGRTPAPAGHQPAVTTTTAAGTPTPTPWPPSGVEPVSYTVEELRKRGDTMAGYLRDVLPKVLAPASKIQVSEFGGEASGKFYDGQTSMNTAVTFVAAGARYSIVITTWVPGTAPSPAELCDAGADCTWLDSSVVATTEDLGEPELTTVHDFRDTGAMVAVTSYNYDMTSAVPHTYLPAGPVTREQLRAIATDPELGL